MGVCFPCISFLSVFDSVKKDDVGSLAGKLMGRSGIDENTACTELIQSGGSFTLSITCGLHRGYSEGWDDLNCEGEVERMCPVHRAGRGWDMCRCCSFGGKDINDRLLSRERAFVSYIVKHTDEGEKLLKGELPDFDSVEFLFGVFNNFNLDHPMCVPLAGFIVECLKEDDELYEMVCGKGRQGILELSGRVLERCAVYIGEEHCKPLSSEVYIGALREYIEEYYIHSDIPEDFSIKSFNEEGKILLGAVDLTKDGADASVEPLGSEEDATEVGGTDDWARYEEMANNYSGGESEEFCGEAYPYPTPSYDETDEGKREASNNEQLPSSDVEEKNKDNNGDSSENSDNKEDVGGRDIEVDKASPIPDECLSKESLPADCDEAAGPWINSFEKPDFNPAGELGKHMYFTRKVEVTEGGYLSSDDRVRRVKRNNRRYLIPFCTARDGADKDGDDIDMIVHHEIHSDELKGAVDCTRGDTYDVQREIDFFNQKVRIDRCMVCEVVYVVDQEKYILLMWNRATTRFIYIDLVYKADGYMLPVPITIIKLLKHGDIKIVCYQPYLICGIMSLYLRDVEVKNVHSIYSVYSILMRDRDMSGDNMERVIGAYTINPSDRIMKEMYVVDKKYHDRCLLIRSMPLYYEIFKFQYAASELCGDGWLCAGRHKKDMMYGYSYLLCGVYPSMTGTAFRLLPNGHIKYKQCPVPSISYSEGYFVSYVFKNVDEGGSGERIANNEKANRRARSLLFKELSTKLPAFYHNHIKILYFDDYTMSFFMDHEYFQANMQFIETAIKRECTRHKISTDKFKNSCYVTTFDMVRYVNQH